MSIGSTYFVGDLAVIGSNLFAATSGYGVFRSTNDGASWTAVNNGLTENWVYDLTVSGTNLFAKTSSGIFLSTNNGTSWSATSVVGTLVVSGGTNLFAVTDNSVFLSTNNGTSWSSKSTGFRGCVKIGCKADFDFDFKV